MATPPLIRPCTDGDLPQIQAIYAHHVLHGIASFETEAPDVVEMRRRRQAVAERGFPYLVAEFGGEIVGYAYAGPYRARPGYRFSAENSIYIRHDMAGRGIGKALLAPLIAGCAAMGLRQMIAVIGDSENHASINLHKSLGFRMAGNLRSVGFKFGRWIDSVLMQRALGPGDASLPE
ncbi:MAG TPA: GNAT family N-acetyltransferase [Stellaceae bacterium]|nr:GNAT family N-acetyltransferase [Stellaceae bacterium]